MGSWSMNLPYGSNKVSVTDLETERGNFLVYSSEDWLARGPPLRKEPELIIYGPGGVVP